MVLKSKEGGSLTFEGCLEILTRQQPLELWTNKGGDLFTVHSLYPQRDLAHTLHIPVFNL